MDDTHIQIDGSTCLSRHGPNPCRQCKQRFIFFLKSSYNSFSGSRFVSPRGGSFTVNTLLTETFMSLFLTSRRVCITLVDSSSLLPLYPQPDTSLYTSNTFTLLSSPLGLLRESEVPMTTCGVPGKKGKEYTYSSCLWEASVTWFPVGETRPHDPPSRVTDRRIPYAPVRITKNSSIGCHSVVTRRDLSLAGGRRPDNLQGPVRRQSVTTRPLSKCTERVSYGSRFSTTVVPPTREKEKNTLEYRKFK